MTDIANGREIVLNMLLKVIEEGKLSSNVLNHTLAKYQELDKKERAFIARLFTGTLERYITLDYIINKFSSTPTGRMKPVIRNILRLSVYQMNYMEQVPVSAVCNEAVKLAKKRGLGGLSGFVNAVLRSIAQNLTDIVYPDKDKDPLQYLEVMYSVSREMASMLLAQYGFETAQVMLSDSLKVKATAIRCNRRRVEPSELKEILISEGITVEDGKYLDYAFRISGYDYLDNIKAFKKGLFTVQDESSMLVCEAAGLNSDSYVIDVCAAPGGKALHAAETACFVSARDVSDTKIKLIEENKLRLGIDNLEIMIWDAVNDRFQDHGRADVVIADLPCSGLGVLGKKPDIKYNMTQNQQKELVSLQRRILSTACQYVKPGGVLIYSTCTVNKEENIENMEWFLENHDFHADSLLPYISSRLAGKEAESGYLQLIQGIHDCDGFFISRMRRNMRD